MSDKWNLEIPKNPQLEGMLQKFNPDKTKSKGLLAKLKRMLLYNLLYAFPITGAAITIMIVNEELVIKALLLVLVLFCTWAIGQTMQLYFSIEEDAAGRFNLAENLRYYKRQVHKWKSLQEKVGVIIYPFSISAGFLLGGTAESEKGALEFLSSTSTMILLLVVIAILTPLCYYSVKWMYKVMLGHYLADIDTYLNDLESQ